MFCFIRLFFFFLSKQAPVWGVSLIFQQTANAPGEATASPQLLREPQCKTGRRGEVFFFFNFLFFSHFFFSFSFFNKVVTSSRDVWPGFPSRKIKKAPKQGRGREEGVNSVYKRHIYTVLTC